MVEYITKKSKPTQLSCCCEWEETRSIVTSQDSTAAVIWMSWGGDGGGWSEGSHSRRAKSWCAQVPLEECTWEEKKKHPRRAQPQLHSQVKRRGEKSTIWQSLADQSGVAFHMQTWTEITLSMVSPHPLQKREESQSQNLVDLDIVRNSFRTVQSPSCQNPSPHEYCYTFSYYCISAQTCRIQNLHPSAWDCNK